VIVCRRRRDCQREYVSVENAQPTRTRRSPVDEFLCLTVRSRPGEAAADFAARLSRFWTHMLRTRPDDFEKVYAETTAFEEDDDVLTRQYLLREEVADLLCAEMTAAGVARDA